MRGDDLWASTSKQLAKRNSESRVEYSREMGGDEEVETGGIGGGKKNKRRRQRGVCVCWGDSEMKSKKQMRL